MSDTFTVTTYNIHKGMSPLNRYAKVNGIAAALKQLNPDILLLQEVQGQHLQRTLQFNDFPDQSQHEFFGEFLSLNSSYGKNAIHPNRHHGNAVLSRFPLDPKHNVNISVNRLEHRGVLHCEIYPPNWSKPLVILCAHLNLLEHDRIKQYQAIADYVLNTIDPSWPLILGGDFNDWKFKSDHRIAHHLGLTEAYVSHCGHLAKTFPAKLPVLSLDRLYVRHLEVVKAVVHDGEPWSGLSDHLPISAVLKPNFAD